MCNGNTQKADGPPTSNCSYNYIEYISNFCGLLESSYNGFGRLYSLTFYHRRVEAFGFALQLVRTIQQTRSPGPSPMDFPQLMVSKSPFLLANASFSNNSVLSLAKGS